MRRTIIIGAVLAVAGLAGGAWASDGCVEISQVNVATAGTISAPGCYVLTSDLSQGLTVNPLTGVTIDLNGFTVAPGSGPAVTLNGPIDNLEIRNGTLESIAGADAVSLTVAGANMFNHVYRDLRIRSGARGIFYQMAMCLLEDVQLENVVIHADAAGVEMLGAEDVVELRNIRFHRAEIRSEGGGILLGPTPGLTFAMRIYGFQVESSSIVSLAGMAAVFVNTSLVAGGAPVEAEFEGSIRDCELVAPDTGGFGVVSLDARQGVLHCSGNNLMATDTGAQNEYAFWAPGPALIIIRDNTSTVAHTAGVPFSGAVVSPQIGHDGTTYLLSNFDVWTGPY